MRRIILFAAVPVCVSACFVKEAPECACPSSVEVSFAVSDRTTRGELFYGEGESDINDVDLFLYRTDTGQLDSYHHFDSDGPGAFGSRRVTLLVNVPYVLCALANFGGVDDLPASLDGVEAYVYDFGSPSGVFEHGLPMAGKTNVSAASAGAVVPMELKRLVSRIDMGFAISDGQFAESNASSVLGVKLRQSPFVCAPFNPLFVPGPDQVGDGDLAEDGGGLLDPFVDSGGGFPSGRVSFYSLANPRGRLPVETGSKYPSSGQEAASCTYVEVKYRQDDAAESLGYAYKGVVYYRFYVGEDNEDDFSLLPNSVYSLRLNFWSEGDGRDGLEGSWTATDYRYSRSPDELYLAQRRRLITLATPQADLVWSLEASGTGAPVTSDTVLSIEGDEEGCTVSAIGCGCTRIHMISRLFGTEVCSIPVEVEAPELVVEDSSPDINGTPETIVCSYRGRHGEIPEFDPSLFSSLLEPAWNIADGELGSGLALSGDRIYVEHPVDCIPWVGKRVADAVTGTAPCGITASGAVRPSNAMLANEGNSTLFIMDDYAYVRHAGASSSFGVIPYDTAPGGGLEVLAVPHNPAWPNEALQLEWGCGEEEVSATLLSDTSLAHTAGVVDIIAKVTNPHSGESFSVKLGEGEVYVHASLAAHRNLRISSTVRDYPSIHLSGYEYTVDVNPCLVGEDHPLAREFLDEYFDESGERPAAAGEGLFCVPEEMSWTEVSDYVDGDTRAVLVARSVSSRYFSLPVYTDVFVFPTRSATVSTLYSPGTYSIIGWFDPSMLLYYNDKGIRKDTLVYKKYLVLSLYGNEEPLSGGWL